LINKIGDLITAVFFKQYIIVLFRMTLYAASVQK